MRKKLLLSSLLFTGALSGCVGSNEAATPQSSAQSLSASAKTLAQAAVKIQRIDIGKLSGDSASQFTSNLFLTNTATQDINNWQIGFYMPRVLNSIPGKASVSLLMTICEDGTKTCANLKYLRADFTQTDLSTGFTTMLEPSEKFTLAAGKSYTISLQHIPTAALNYSAAPQGFFLVQDNQVVNLETTPASYNFIDYNAQQITSDLQQHQNNVWNSSAPLTTPLNVIPSPQNVSYQSGSFALTQNLVISAAADNASAAKTVAKFLAQNFNLTTTANSSATPQLAFINDASISNPEGYRLTISSDGIQIASSNPSGSYYAVQTLLQIIDQYGTSLPALTINDAPRFKYRGLMLDSARHYFTVNEIKNLIDLMATQKLNTLHWHLSDDEGFRIAVSGYPELTQIGASRGYGQLINGMDFLQKNLDITVTPENNDFATVASDYAGAYTEQAVKELIKYANERQITIIPEIDIPGHSRAMMKALPNSFYDPADKSQYAGYGDDTLPVCHYNDNSSALGRNFTYDINQVVANIANLFNNQATLYSVANEISIGGDEVNKYSWSDSPQCNTSPEWASLSALEKEHLFFAKLTDYLKSSQIKISGWEEFVLDSVGLVDVAANRNVAAQDAGHVWIWQKTAPTTAAYAVDLANKGYPTVLDYASNAYFDMRYTTEKQEPGFYWATDFGDTAAAMGITSAITATTKLVNPDKVQNIVGIEGAIWGDVIPNYQHLQYMAFPKMAGIAEAAWSLDPDSNPQSQANWRSLATRLGCGNSGFLHYIAQNFGVNYRGYPYGIAQEAPQVCNGAGI